MEHEPFVGNWPASRSRCRPLALTQVKVAGFLGERIDRNNRTSLPAGFHSPLPRGFEQFLRREPFDPECLRYGPDSDLFRWLEGASYAVAYDPDNAEVRRELDHVVGLLLQAQEEDGPIATYIKPARRWDTEMWHDLCMAGLLIEAAVAHHRATADRRLLEAAQRWADYLLAAYQDGQPYFKGVGEREHPEIELALVRLYRATGERRYLDFSLAIAGLSHVGPTVAELCCGAGRRHGVRVGYLLTALAELAMETGEACFAEQLPGLWDELVRTRSYLTGGLAFRPAEIIPERPYDLPQSGRVAETCASVAMAYLGWRLHATNPDPRYFDHIETILYNHFLGALSLDQLGIFYYNPLHALPGARLESDAGQSALERTRLPKLHGCTCCWASTWRYLPQLPEYILSADDAGLLVNLYTSVSAQHVLAEGTPLRIEIETDYPHDGRVLVRLLPEAPVRCSLRLRVPGWCREATVAVNQEPWPTPTPGSYYAIARQWTAGDEVELHLAMDAEAVAAHPVVAECAGQVAFRRGPLVYCLDQADVPQVALDRVRLDCRRDRLPCATSEWRPDLLGGVHVLRVPLAAAPAWDQESGPYRALVPARPLDQAMFIPFYARANREGDRGWLTWIPLGPSR